MLDLAEKILKDAEDEFDYAEVKAEKLSKNTILQKNGNIDMLHSSETSGLMLRTLKDGALSAIFVNDLSNVKAKEIIKKAIRASNESKKTLKTPIKKNIFNLS